MLEKQDPRSHGSIPHCLICEQISLVQRRRVRLKAQSQAAHGMGTGADKHPDFVYRTKASLKVHFLVVILV